MLFIRKLTFTIIEIKIFILILKAETYNVLSTSFFIRITFLENYLENCCKNIAFELKNLGYPKKDLFVNDKIIIVSRIQKGGGITKILKKILDNENCFLVNTNIFNYKSIRIIDPKIKFKSDYLKNFSFIKRIEKLVTYFSNNKTKKIYILNDSTDPLPYISFLICNTNSNFFNFYHHADHSFSFGMFEKNWNHFDLFQNQFINCKKKLDPKFLSLTNFL